jgi:hypothetical protein
MRRRGSSRLPLGRNHAGRCGNRCAVLAVFLNCNCYSSYVHLAGSSLAWHSLLGGCYRPSMFSRRADEERRPPSILQYGRCRGLLYTKVLKRGGYEGYRHERRPSTTANPSRPPESVRDGHLSRCPPHRWKPGGWQCSVSQTTTRSTLAIIPTSPHNYDPAPTIEESPLLPSSSYGRRSRRLRRLHIGQDLASPNGAMFYGGIKLKITTLARENSDSYSRIYTFLVPLSL